MDALQDELVQQGLNEEVQILETSRLGDPVQFGPDLMVYPEGVHYANLSVDDIPFLVEEHFLKGRVVNKFCCPGKRHRPMKSWECQKRKKSGLS